MKRYIAHWFMGGDGQDTTTADTLDELIPFVLCRIPSTKRAQDGVSLRVADRKSRSTNPWLWSMTGGGRSSWNTRIRSAKDFSIAIAALLAAEGQEEDGK